MMDPSIASIYADLERRHWWLRARRTIVVDQIRQRSGKQSDVSVLEIGCGAGENLRALGEGYRTVGVEPDPLLRSIGQDHGSEILSGALPDDLPSDLGLFDVVLLLDVLEHIENDVAAIRRCGELTGDGGQILVTVPAMPWLWSRHDRYARHYRRYTRASLATVVSNADLGMERCSYYNFLLFGPLVLTRLWDKAFRSKAGPPDLSPPARPLNEFLRMCMALETPLLRRVNVPWGGSILAWLSQS